MPSANAITADTGAGTPTRMGIVAAMSLAMLQRTHNYRSRDEGGLRSRGRPPTPRLSQLGAAAAE